ncbi:hypothetical protein Tco_1503721 [Tanacetum coccineum]
MSHDKLRILVVGCFQWLVLCFCSSWSDDPPCCKSETDSAKVLCEQGAYFLPGGETVPSLPTVFSWVGSISPDGFLSSILLLVLIIVAVVIVVVTVVLVVVIDEVMVMASSKFEAFKAITFPSHTSRYSPMKSSLSFFRIEAGRMNSTMDNASSVRVQLQI